MHYSLHYVYNNYNYNVTAMCEIVGVKITLAEESPGQA